MHGLKQSTGGSRLSQLLRESACDRRGTILIKAALLLPALMLCIGNTIDHVRYMRAKQGLQSAADAAALGAAKELGLTDTNSESIGAIAAAMVAAYVSANSKDATAPKPVVTTAVSGDPIEVDVTVTASLSPAFGDTFGLGLPEISARAVAKVIGKPNICVLGLNESEGGTISLEQNALVTGRNCAVYSNSNHTNGLKSKNSASLEASFICSRGGKDGGLGNFSPAPIVDCPRFEDPLEGRPEPFADECNPAKPTVIEFDTELDPDTYCGLEIRSGAKVKLRDGVFVFKDKPLVVKDGAALTSEAAGMYFVGQNANFTFERASTISLKAPTDGPLAGLLVFGSRSQPDSLTYSILSDDARVLIGTIYLPKGELRVDATSPIADESAYTAIVADKMRLYGGPHLVLNTNYDQTGVPVPKGIRGTGQPVALSR